MDETWKVRLLIHIHFYWCDKIYVERRLSSKSKYTILHLLGGESACNRFCSALPISWLGLRLISTLSAVSFNGFIVLDRVAICGLHISYTLRWKNSYLQLIPEVHWRR
jgi:hypothetical protein